MATPNSPENAYGQDAAGTAGSESQKDLKKLITDNGAVLQGHFRLASGRHSDVYIEKFRILERPPVLEAVSGAIVQHFRGTNPDLIVGPSTGGILVAYEAARQLGVPAVYVEAQDGKRVLKRGGRIQPHSRVLLVDDVLTTGVSLQETKAVIEAAGANLVGVGVLIDRSGRKIDFGCEFFAATRFEAVSYAEDEVPDWLSQIPLTTPGTRANTLSV